MGQRSALSPARGRSSTKSSLGGGGAGSGAGSGSSPPGVGSPTSPGDEGLYEEEEEELENHSKAFYAIGQLKAIREKAQEEHRR